MFAVNAAFFFMELQHFVTGKLIMISGEFGPVEIELIVSALFCFFGYIGPEKAHYTIAYTFELDYE